MSSTPPGFGPQWKWRFVDGTQPLPPNAVVVADPVIARCLARQYEEWARQLALSEGDLAWEIFVRRPPRGSATWIYPFNGPLPEGWREKLAAFRQGYAQWIAERGPTAVRQTLIREPYAQPQQRVPDQMPPSRCRNAMHPPDCGGGEHGCERSDV